MQTRSHGAPSAAALLASESVTMTSAPSCQLNQACAELPSECGLNCSHWKR